MIFLEERTIRGGKKGQQTAQKNRINEEITAQESTEKSSISDGEEDELYSQAVDIIKSEGKASTSFL